MARLHNRFLNSTNSLITMLISLLGFSSSCKKDEQMYMYGTQVNNFVVIKGYVQSAENSQPVPEIIVEIREVVGNQDGVPQTQLCETSFSQTNGQYRLALIKDKTYQLRFSDTDGLLNGNYETLDTTVVTNEEQFPKENVGLGGEPEKEMTIKLKPKK